MSRIAASLMFLAWIFYGAMPVMAAPSMSMSPAQHAMQDHSMHKNMAKPAGHSNTKTPVACPHGKGCVMPFCAACLSVLPALAAMKATGDIRAHPAPPAPKVLIAVNLMPLTPPPRA